MTRDLLSCRPFGQRTHPVPAALHVMFALSVSLSKELYVLAVTASAVF